ncbi:alkaline phosphatase [Bacteroidales bacterium OttesenSCG-928-J19]|nr:alkaline phosphatase [Bacteroidales bacterium OttesenSCG-928-J19]
MKRINLLWIVAISFCFAQCGAKETQKEESKPQIKNVILMIGDGMGVSQVYAGMTANHNQLNLERTQYIGFSKTYSASDYVTDSAAGGTAIATGTKTKNGMVGIDSVGNPVKSALAYAAENDLSTGIVVSCNLTHATPASFIAHQKDRGMTQEIAADFLTTPFTVAIGGGRKDFEQRKDEQNITEQLRSNGYQVAYTLEEAKQIKSGKLIALTAEDHPAKYPERGELLPEGVGLALDILSQNDNGFFLMVEGSQIDWGGHSNDTEMIAQEMQDFDRAIKVAFDFADTHPGTLVVITADHETGGMSLNGGDFEVGTVQARYTTKSHSGVMVPVYAYGSGAEDFAGIYENTDLLGKILRFYNITP